MVFFIKSLGNEILALAIENIGPCRTGVEERGRHIPIIIAGEQARVTNNLGVDDDVFGPLNPLGIPGFVQSTRGEPGDFEVVVLVQGGFLEHWTKHNSAPWTQRPGSWYLHQRFDSAMAHAEPALVQSRLGAAGELEAGQGELHYVCSGADGQMCYYVRPAGGSWGLAATF